MNAATLEGMLQLIDTPSRENGSLILALAVSSRPRTRSRSVGRLTGTPNSPVRPSADGAHFHIHSGGASPV
jgi:hypothetical protein